MYEQETVHINNAGRLNNDFSEEWRLTTDTRAPIRVLKHARSTRGHMWWSPWTDENMKATDWTNLRQCPSYTQCTLPSKTNRQTTSREGNQVNIKRKHRTRHNWVRKPRRLRTENRRVAPILYRLPKTKLGNHQRFLFPSLNGRVHRHVERSAHLFNLEYKLRLLEIGNRRTRLREGHPYQLLWPLSVCADIFWTKIRVYHLTEGNRRYHVLCEVKFVSRLLRRYILLFENHRTTS